VARHRLVITGAGGRYPSEADDPSSNRRVGFLTIPK